MLEAAGAAADMLDVPAASAVAVVLVSMMLPAVKMSSTLLLHCGAAAATAANPRGKARVSYYAVPSGFPSKPFCSVGVLGPFIRLNYEVTLKRGTL